MVSLKRQIRQISPSKPRQRLTGRSDSKSSRKSMARSVDEVHWWPSKASSFQEGRASGCGPTPGNGPGVLGHKHGSYRVLVNQPFSPQIHAFWLLPLGSGKTAQKLHRQKPKLLQVAWAQRDLNPRPSDYESLEQSCVELRPVVGSGATTAISTAFNRAKTTNDTTEYDRPR